MDKPAVPFCINCVHYRNSGTAVCHSDAKSHSHTSHVTGEVSNFLKGVRCSQTERSEAGSCGPTGLKFVQRPAPNWRQTAARWLVYLQRVFA